MILAAPPAPAALHASLRTADVRFAPATSASGVGDVDGDGHPDIAVVRGRTVEVAFGPFARGVVDPRRARRFRIVAQWRVHVTAAGDVNGDGRADLLISSTCDPESEPCPHRPVYVVFGRARGVVDLARLGSAGFAIEGSTGTSVAAGGDVNGDGRSDVVVAEQEASPAGRARGGSVWVVFGRGGSASVDLAALGSGGLRIDGAAGAEIGGSPALIGDVNGDGRAEVAFLSGPHGDYGGGTSARVVYGRSTPGAVDAAAAAGFEIPGPQFGFLALASAGDVDGDGRGDLLLANDEGEESDLVNEGSVTVRLASGGGYTVETGFVTALADAGDVDGDGHPDAIVGTGVADAGKNLNRGGAVVVFGRGTAPHAPLLWLDSPAAHCACAERGDTAGFYVGGAGDVNGDGRADYLVGATAAYLEFGPRIVTGTSGADTLRGTSASEIFAAGAGDDVVLGGGGNDTIDGGPGNDRLAGGAGADWIEGGRGRDVIDGGPGADDLFGERGPADYFRGGSLRAGEADAIRGGGGDDLIGGGGGNDVLGGGSGRDSVFGEDGNDRVFGEAGDDRVFGDGLADWSVLRFTAGGRGRDLVSGGAGSDDVWGGGGIDHLLGGPGDDTLHSGPGADIVDGGPGFDRCDTGGPGDRLESVEKRL